MKNLWERLSEQDKQTLNKVDEAFDKYLLKTLGRENNYSWQRVLEERDHLSDLDIHQWATLSQDLGHDTINETFRTTFK